MYSYTTLLQLNDEEKYNNIQASWIYYVNGFFFKEIFYYIFLKLIFISTIFYNFFNDFYFFIVEICTTKQYSKISVISENYTQAQRYKIHNYNLQKYPPFLFFFNLKEAIDEQEDTFNRIFKDYPSGEGGPYEANLFKKNIAYTALVEYVTLLNTIYLDVQKKEYMERFLIDIKLNARALFPGQELGLSEDCINSVEEFERYLGFDSLIEPFRDDDRRFKKFDSWYNSAIYKYSVYRCLYRSGEILNNLNMHRDFIADGLIALKLDNDPYYEDLRSYLQPSIYHMIDYLFKTISLLKEGYNLFYFNCYYGDSFDFLMKPNNENTVTYSQGQYHLITFERFFQPKVYKVPYKYYEINDLVRMRLPKDGEEIPAELKIDERPYYKDFEKNKHYIGILSEDERCHEINKGLSQKFHEGYFDFLKRFFKKYVRIMKTRPLRSTLSGLELQLFDIRLKHMYKNYFYDAIIDFNLFLEEINFNTPHTVQSMAIDRLNPEGSNFYLSQYVDEIIATQSAYLEPFKEIASTWTGCKYELFSLYVNHGLSVDSFTDTYIYQYIMPISPQLAYFIGYYYYAFLIYSYTHLVPELFLKLMFDVLYKLNVSDIYYGFSGYFIYMFIGFSAIIGCLVLSSRNVLKSSLLLQLILFEATLISSCFLMLLMLIRFQYIDDILDEVVDWPAYRFFTYYTIDEHILFSFCGRNLWLLVFILLCLFAFECAFGIIMIIIAFNKLKSFHKAYKLRHLAGQKDGTASVNYGFGLKFYSIGPVTRYQGTNFDHKHLYYNIKPTITLSTHDIQNESLSEDVVKYIKIKKQEQDLAQYINKYESDIDWREPWKKKKK